MPELKDFQQSHADRLLHGGRWLIWILCFSIPLAFCKETMYIFQVKTFLLQVGGMLLLATLLLHQVWTRGRDRLITHPIFFLLLIFAFWQVYKSYDSIAPVISQRNLSRMVWLPILMFCFQYFVRTRAQFERSLDVIIASAVGVYFIAGFLYSERGSAFLLEGVDTFWEIGKGFWGGLLNHFFYSESLRDLCEEESFPAFALAGKSFYPGKFDAGTFGNKNFLAAYINMVSMLMVYRSVVLMRSHGWRIYGGMVSFLLALASFIHLVPLENRGSWLGFLAGGFAAGLYLSFKCLKPSHLRRALLGLGLAVLLTSGGFYLVSPERFVSIFSTSHGSNELRRHTWINYFKAWAQDNEWSGFESDAKRWLTGFGFYSFRVNYPKVRSERIFQLENNQHNSETTHPHNEYLGVLGELGGIGLCLYLAFIGWMLVRLWRWKSLSSEDRLLGAVLMFSLVSILIHQFVTVAGRYTGVAFQTWIIFALVLWREADRIHVRHFERYLIGPSLFVLAWLAMPSLDWPLQWMRSQHAYEMGQIYFNTLGDYHGKLRAHEQKMRVATQEVQKLQKQGKQIAPEAAQNYRRGMDILKRQTEMFEDTFEKANRYFEAGYQLDPANFESLYIGSNLNVQFATQDLAALKLERSEQRYQKALLGYAEVAKVMPYFVQLRYWQGSAYKGLATLEIKKLELAKLSDTQKQDILKRAGQYFIKAISFYDQYEKQDPTYKELFLDRYFCYRYLDQTDRALNELVKYLKNLERGGYPVFSSERRHDARSLMGHVIKLVDEKDLSKALVIYRNLLRYYNSSLLLPFTPKTERHLKNSFRLLEL
jgi:hypothetical protein